MFEVITKIENMFWAGGNKLGAKLIGNEIIRQQFQLSSKISRKLNERYTNFLYESDLEDEEIVKWRARLIELIGLALVSGQYDEVWEQVTDWAEQTGAGAVQYNIAIDELLQTNKVYREIIWEFVEGLGKEEFTFATFLQINKVIDSILDQTAYIFSSSYVKHHAKTLRLARETMLDISTPIVTISDTIAVLPLVGDIDTYRARVLMETALKKCSDLRNSELIIDLSGVPIVDTMVANELFKVANALNLIGVKPTITGIRPEIAQAVVNLGIDFRNIRTLGTLKQALHQKI